MTCLRSHSSLVGPRFEPRQRGSGGCAVTTELPPSALGQVGYFHTSPFTSVRLIPVSSQCPSRAGPSLCSSWPLGLPGREDSLDTAALSTDRGITTLQPWWGALNAPQSASASPLQMMDINRDNSCPTELV